MINIVYYETFTQVVFPITLIHHCTKNDLHPISEADNATDLIVGQFSESPFNAANTFETSDSFCYIL